jgi:VWFA-related protein
MIRSTTLTLAGLVGAALAAAKAAVPEQPVSTDLQEEVTVRLGEVQILVTDKDGRAVRDLKLDEIELREAGEKRRILSLEPYSQRDLSSQVLPQPTPIAGEAPVPQEQRPVVLPPPPIRRIVFLFDAFNSRSNDRPKWVTAARTWVKSEMQPSDSVAIAMLLRGEVRFVLEFTNVKELVEATLASSGFLDGSDYYDSMADIKNLMSDLETCDRAYDPSGCARTASQAYVHEWRIRAEDTIESLRRFSAAMATIPGRKAVLYLSDGVVQDPGQTATTAILGRLGSDRVDRSRLEAVMRRNVLQELQQLNRVASGANVTYFTFDARPSSRKEIAGNAEQGFLLHERGGMEDPFSAMFNATRGSLDILSVGTGGRSYHGPQLLKTVPEAAAAIEGLYTVTFYRDPAAGVDPKLKIKLLRKGLVVTFPDKFDPRRHRPLTVSLELAVSRTSPLGDGWEVPVQFQIPLSVLELKSDPERKRYWSQVAVFVEAIAPDGRRLGEAHQIVDVSLPEAEYTDRLTKKFTHSVSVKTQLGPQRLRIRFGDVPFRVQSEKSLDVTLRSDGSVLPGIQNLGSNQESGRFGDPTPP